MVLSVEEKAGAADSSINFSSSNRQFWVALRRGEFFGPRGLQ